MKTFQLCIGVALMRRIHISNLLYKFHEIEAIHDLIACAKKNNAQDK